MWNKNGERDYALKTAESATISPPIYLRQSGGKNNRKNYAANALMPTQAFADTRPFSNAGAKVRKINEKEKGTEKISLSEPCQEPYRSDTARAYKQS
jgi:hypothetical protein